MTGSAARSSRASGVTKRFGAFTAVDRSRPCELQDRRLHALIGPNGAGKTTLFNIVSGMFAPDRGSVKLGERRIERLPPEAVAARGLSRSFQITSLFPVAERVGAPAARRAGAFAASASIRCSKPARCEEVNTQTRELVRFLGLEGVESVAVGNLSYGGQRLVEIGVALSAKPRALLLDEPLVGLAAAERERITALIRGLTQHMAVLLVEHDIDRVFAIADKITVMNEGRVLVEGDAETVRGDPEVQRVYIGGGQHVHARERARRRRLPATRCSPCPASTPSTARATSCTTSVSRCASTRSSPCSVATAPASRRPSRASWASCRPQAAPSPSARTVDQRQNAGADRAPGRWPGAAGAAPVRGPHGGGEPAAGRAVASRRQRRALGPRAHLQLLSTRAGQAAHQGRSALRRRAADGGDRARTVRQREDPAAGRAVRGSVARRWSTRCSNRSSSCAARSRS